MGRARGSAPRGGAPRPTAVAPLRLQGEAVDLQSAYDDYRAAAGGGSPDLLSTPNMSAVRVALIRTLIADGWVAPAIVLERLHQDEEVLRPHLFVAS